MAKYKVIAEFVYRGIRISPKDTREWVPPNEEIAKRLVRAGCLKVKPETVAGETFGREAVINLMEKINEAVAEGQADESAAAVASTTVTASTGMEGQMVAVGPDGSPITIVQSEEIPQEPGEPEAVAAEAPPAPSHSPAPPPGAPMDLPSVGAAAAAGPAKSKRTKRSRK